VLTLALSLTVGERHPRAGRSAEVAEIRSGFGRRHRHAGPERVRPPPAVEPAARSTGPPAGRAPFEAACLPSDPPLLSLARPARACPPPPPCQDSALPGP
jgi:hypothetical protein